MVLRISTKNKDSTMPMPRSVFFNGCSLWGDIKMGAFGEEEREKSKCDEMKKVEMVAVPLLERKQVRQWEGIK